MNLTFIHLAACAVFFAGVPWITHLLTGATPETDLFHDGAVLSVWAYAGGCLIPMLVLRRGRIGFRTLICRLESIVMKAFTLWVPFTFLLMWLLRFYLMIHHNVFLLGVDTTTSTLAKIPYSIIIASYIAEIMTKGALLASALALAPHQKKKPYVAWMLILGEITYAIVNSRRYLLEILIVLLLTRVAMTKRSLTRILPLVLIGTALFAIAAPVMITIRYEYLSNKTLDSQEAFLDSVKKASETTWEELVRYLAKNLERRPLLLDMNIEIATAQGQSRLQMNGQAMWRNAEWILPRFMLPSKLDMLMPEETIQDFFGLPIRDVGSNWAAFGMADWEIPGAFLAGVLFMALLLLMMNFTEALSSHLAFAPFCILGTALSLSIQVEQEPLTALIALRSLLLVVLLEWSFTFFLKRRCLSLTAGTRNS